MISFKRRRSEDAGTIVPAPGSGHTSPQEGKPIQKVTCLTSSKSHCPSSSRASYTPAWRLAPCLSDRAPVSTASQTLYRLRSVSIHQDSAINEGQVMESCGDATKQPQCGRAASLQATVPLFTPGTAMPKCPRLAETPRSCRSIHGALCTPATAACHTRGVSPSAAMTPPHLDASINSLAEPASNMPSPEKHVRAEAYHVDDRRIMPPHLPSNQESLLPNSGRTNTCDMGTGHYCSSPEADTSSPVLPVSSPAPTMITTKCSIAWSYDGGPAGVSTKTASHSGLSSSPTRGRHKISALAHLLAKPVSPVPSSPLPSPSLQPHVPSTSNGHIPYTPAARQCLRSSWQCQRNLGASDMEYLCDRLGHLSTRRAPSAPPDRSQLVSTTAKLPPPNIFRRASCSPTYAQHQKLHSSSGDTCGHPCQ